MKPDTIWPALIAQYRRRHTLTQAAFAERFSVSQQTVSRWEAGIQSPSLNVQAELRSVVGLSALSNAAAWHARISDSYGTEILFDADWRILAASRAMLIAAGAIADDAIGKKLEHLPGFALCAAMLAKAPLFGGALRVLKVRAEFSLPASRLVRDVDLWPVLTSDDKLLIHLAAYGVGEAKPASGIPGVQLIEVQGVLLDGTIIPIDDEALAV